MKKRLLSWILLTVGAVSLIIGFGAPFIELRNYAPESGIVGGADTPTYWRVMLDQFKMNGWPMCYILFGGAMLLTGVFRLIFPETVIKCCPRNTTMVTLGISAFAGSGLLFGLGMMIIAGFAGSDRHPIAGPVYMALTIISILGFMMLIYFYIFLRSVYKSRLGAFLDMVTVILYLPAFFWTIGIAFEQAEAIYRSLK